MAVVNVIKAFVKAVKEHYREMMQNRVGEIEVDGVEFEYKALDILSFMKEYGVDVSELLMNNPIEIVGEYAGEEWPLYSVITFELDGKDVPVVFLLRPKERDGRDLHD